MKLNTNKRIKIIDTNSEFFGYSGFITGEEDNSYDVFLDARPKNTINIEKFPPTFKENQLINTN